MISSFINVFNSKSYVENDIVVSEPIRYPITKATDTIQEYSVQNPADTSSSEEETILTYESSQVADLLNEIKYYPKSES